QAVEEWRVEERAAGHRRPAHSPCGAEERLEVGRGPRVHGRVGGVRRVGRGGGVRRVGRVGLAGRVSPAGRESGGGRRIRRGRVGSLEGVGVHTVTSRGAEAGWAGRGRSAEQCSGVVWGGQGGTRSAGVGPAAPDGRAAPVVWVPPGATSASYRTSL